MATTHETMPRAEVVNAVCGCETHAVERKAIAVEPSIKVGESEAAAPNRGPDPRTAEDGRGGSLLR